MAQFLIRELSSAIRSGTLTSEALVTDCLARVKRLNPSINAFSRIFESDALTQARLCDAEARKGQFRGPLHGIPMGVKDLFFVKGQVCQRGSAAYRDFVATDTAPIVDRMISAGAIALGRTTTTELGWSGSSNSEFYGPTRNPWNTALTSGGSSSGSAAAVSARMVPFALGSDGGGSLRIPASFCGIFSIKASLGRIPAWPWSATEMLSHVGALTLDAKDGALLLDIAKGPDSRDHQALPDDGETYFDKKLAGQLRIGFVPTLFGTHVDPEVARLVHGSVGAISAGLSVPIETMDVSWEDPQEIFETLWVSSRGVSYGTGKDLNLFGTGFRRLIEASRNYSLGDYLGALKKRAEFCRTVHTTFEDFDLLLMPTIPIQPFDASKEGPRDGESANQVLAWTRWTPFTYPFNVSGNPAASMPCGVTAEGNPVGLQVIGRRHADALVMAFCQASEKFIGIRDLPTCVK